MGLWWRVSDRGAGGWGCALFRGAHGKSEGVTPDSERVEVEKVESRQGEEFEGVEDATSFGGRVEE